MLLNELKLIKIINKPNSETSHLLSHKEIMERNKKQGSAAGGQGTCKKQFFIVKAKSLAKYIKRRKRSISSDREIKTEQSFLPEIETLRRRDQKANRKRDLNENLNLKFDDLQNPIGDQLLCPLDMEVGEFDQEVIVLANQMVQKQRQDAKRGKSRADHKVKESYENLQMNNQKKLSFTLMNNGRVIGTSTIAPLLQYQHTDIILRLLKLRPQSYPLMQSFIKSCIKNLKQDKLENVIKQPRASQQKIEDEVQDLNKKIFYLIGLRDSLTIQETQVEYDNLRIFMQGIPQEEHAEQNIGNYIL
eukprot:403342888